MLRVGITGGIGSGKTTVAKIFEVLGVPIYYADDAAKRLMNEDQALQQKIIENFGADVFENRQLNRTRLASIVFNDPGSKSQHFSALIVNGKYYTSTVIIIGIIVP